MPKLLDVCRHVRSKNAGPYWITVDLFFKTREDYARWADTPALSPASLAPLLGTSPGLVKSYLVPELQVLKLSYPRAAPQGGTMERDMHGGQQYVRLLGLSL